MADLRLTLLDLVNKSEHGADATFLRDGIELPAGVVLAIAGRIQLVGHVLSAAWLPALVLG